MRFLTPRLSQLPKTTRATATPAQLSSSFTLFLNAFLQMIRFDYFLCHGSFSKLHEAVHNCPLGTASADADAVQRIVAAVDYATICYWKPVLCLQHSAVTACLLKRFGIPAELVIGAQLQPFKAHAWVEVGGRVVNDKPYVPEIYKVLDRC